MNSNEREAGRNASTIGDRVTLLDIVSALVKHRWLVIGSTMSAALLAVLFSLYTLFMPPDSKFNPLPNQYAGRVRVLLTWGEMQNKISSLGYDLDINPGALLNPVLMNPFTDLINGLLYGNTILDQVAEEFNFYERFELEDSRAPKTEARRIIKENLLVEPVTQAQIPLFYIFEISYTSEDRIFATEIVTRIVDILEGEFRKITMEQIDSKRKFIESRITVVEQQIETLKQKLFDFQSRYGVIDMPTQIEEQTRLITELRSDIIKKELEIQTLKEYLGPSDSRIVRLENEIEKKNQLIYQLKNEFSNEFIPLNLVPQFSAELKELEQNLRIQEEIYRVLKKEYETVKIEETSSLSNFQVIDPVEVPEKKAGPSRSIICLVLTLTVLLLSVFWAFLKEYLDRAGKHPVESEKLRSIRSVLSLRRKR